ncbi:hypothetical protein ACIP9H_33930 [Streptomyces sp. NPDC088732]|uniref:hypothetical protein n=1 Tax=Streptomyces sp. NPDC088732 TaxID=3365879 RepID=UPI00381E4080
MHDSLTDLRAWSETLCQEGENPEAPGQALITAFDSPPISEDRMEDEYWEQQRRTADLERIRSYYTLEERHGVRVAIGGHIRSDGLEGEIVDTSGQYLMVLVAGQDKPVRWHVTANKEYQRRDGSWIAVTKRLDPFGTADLSGDER